MDIRYFSIKNYRNYPLIIIKYPPYMFYWNFYYRAMCPNDADGKANNEGPDQTAPQSDLGLLCLPRPVCPKT